LKSPVLRLSRRAVRIFFSDPRLARIATISRSRVLTSSSARARFSMLL